MRHQGQFKKFEPVRDHRRLETLIADLRRVVAILDAEIEFEEQQAGVPDIARPEYPVFARSLRARRHNLTGTISALQNSFADANAG